MKSVLLVLQVLNPDGTMAEEKSIGFNIEASQDATSMDLARVVSALEEMTDTYETATSLPVEDRGTDDDSAPIGGWEERDNLIRNARFLTQEMRGKAL